jgi:hypothetical protein
LAARTLARAVPGRAEATLPGRIARHVTTKLAPRHPTRRLDRRRSARLGAIGSPSAAAAALSLNPSGAVAAYQHRIQQPAVARQASVVATDAPIPGRSRTDANAGSGLGAAPGASSLQSVAVLQRAPAQLQRDALFRVPARTARPHSCPFSLELERPG